MGTYPFLMAPFKCIAQRPGAQERNTHMNGIPLDLNVVHQTPQATRVSLEHLPISSSIAKIQSLKMFMVFMKNLHWRCNSRDLFASLKYPHWSILTEASSVRTWTVEMRIELKVTHLDFWDLGIAQWLPHDCSLGESELTWSRKLQFCKHNLDNLDGNCDMGRLRISTAQVPIDGSAWKWLILN